MPLPADHKGAAAGWPPVSDISKMPRDTRPAGSSCI